MQKIGVLGAGAWGTALAEVAARAGRDTILWAREPEVVDSVNTSHENTVFLSGVPLNPALRATGDMADMADIDALLIVSPAQHLRAMLLSQVQHLKKGVPLVICSKGIEVATGKLLSEAVEEVAPGHPVAVLSGPTFAAEVARGMPCALTLACADREVGDKLVQALGQPTFRPYYDHDVVGAQVGGAVKNVLAIACGIVAGLAIGENAKAAVITRGLAEIMRFGALYGAERETLMGLSGLGDLILTCSSTQSRNMSLGKAIGEGRTFAEIMAERNSVAEGAHTVEIVKKIAASKGLSMPITEAVYQILKEGKDVRTVMDALLNRPFTTERR
ncbi:NAD(P)H-dependent glycerol-3-phosphate dehydrogenase [Kordiimonas marina]|uniref:NAD(P)H-dependent glycerol-3-phosphate dehydrogenase n=1 Tax=Kordiimonas marina TaxID=2872312 RepID=UPI001FF0F13E|nr:NAD(P)-dependent glycerol-3-phosphate dehydrogenase [Kordiimonas marina]